MRLLRSLGYRDVRAFTPGMAGWKEAGGAIEGERLGEPVVVERDEARASASRDRLLDRLEKIVGQTASRLLLLWLGVIVGFGLVYWVPTLFGATTLTREGEPVPATVEGLATALYFSFTTGLSIGYGDVVPVGWWRVPAVMEGAADLLLFGFVIAKLTSRRQDQVLDEIHSIAFEERLGRVRTNLHLSLSEFEALASACRGPRTPGPQVTARAESAALVFAGELRTVHELLHRPQRPPEDSTLVGILASVAANLDGLRELLACAGAGPASPTMKDHVATTARLAEEICADCVPHEVGPSLGGWLDRVRERARALPS